MQFQLDFFKRTDIIRITMNENAFAMALMKGEVFIVSQTNFNPDIRIERLELQNFKGVSDGVIEFNCLKNPIEKDTRSDILGIYGQNGSGKTTLLEALHVAKLAMMGRAIPYSTFGSIIAQGTDSARMSITFQISNANGTFYHVEYAFSLAVLVQNASPNALSNSGDIIKAATIAGKSGEKFSTTATTLATLLGAIMIPAAAIAVEGAVASYKLKSSGGLKDSLNMFGETKRLAVFDEVLNLSGEFHDSTIRLGAIIDTRTKDEAFLPKVRQKSFFPNKTATSMKELQKYKERLLIKSKSLIFSDEFIELLFEQDNITEYAQIILDLKAFAIQKIRVLDSKIVGTSEKEVIPLFTANRGIGIRKSDSTTFLDEEGLQTLQTAIKGINVILCQLIPGLSLEAVRQVDIDLDDRNEIVHSPGTKVTVYSVRNNVRIPLTEESAGIIRLISSIGLFSYAFVNPGVTVAIDEIDAGVYEYLLGELLLIFEEYGSGQLIFTCHNLRPMEVLDKKYIYFTTTNPKNRYLKPKSIRNENNLRDVYLREIISGGQEEDLYSATKHGKIASALQKAGEIIGQE